MGLTLVELTWPRGQRLWHPFGDDDGYGFTDRWWSQRAQVGRTYLQAFEEGTEVGRVALNSGVKVNGYAHLPRIREAVLEIQFIEVRQGHCDEGLGSRIVDLFAQRFPDQRLVALPKDGVQEFWGSRLGWSRHAYMDRDEARFRPLLYLQPK